MATERRIHCRTCGEAFDWECSADELPVRCLHCEGFDTYSEVGGTGFILKGAGWAYDGYATPEPGVKHVNWGNISPKERAAGKQALRDHKERWRAGAKDVGADVKKD